MCNHKEWNELLANLFDAALAEYQNTREYAFLQEKQAQLDARMLAAYPEEAHPLVYEFAFETGLDKERTMEFLYRQGLKDCVFLLKELGVLA